MTRSISKSEKLALSAGEGIGGQGCKICRHPELDAIHRELESGKPIAYVPALFENGFSRQTLNRHVKYCLRATSRHLKERHKIASAVDVDRRLALLLDEAEEAYFAAKDVLMLNDELCFDPRVHEINVVYRDSTDRNPQTDEPKLKSAPLSKLLAMISEAGYEPVHSYIRAEDARKGYRDCLQQIESILDRFAKLTGAYQKDRENQTDALSETRAFIHKMAEKMDTNYAGELPIFLELAGHRLTPEVRGVLEKEAQGSLTSLDLS